MKHDLAYVARVLGRLGDPHRRGRFVHVTGTNGKGSCASLLASILDAAGLAVGLYTSPHLTDVRERICFNRRPLSERELVASAVAVEQALAGETTPTYFEAMTFLAFHALAHRHGMARAPLDLSVIEVGVGGRLDATNLIAPEVAVITEVGIDHERTLGDTPEAIAREKLGIVKPGVDFVTGCDDPALRAEVIRGALERGANGVRSAADLAARTRVTGVSSLGTGLAIDHPRFGPLETRLRMIGSHQIRNALCAIEAASLLSGRGFPITAAAVVAGLARARWPGRFEILSRRPLLIVDGAHNPSAAACLAETVRSCLSGRPVRLVFGIFRDKQVGKVVDAIAPAVDEVTVTHAPNERAAGTAELRDLFARHGRPVRIVEEPVAAVRSALADLPAGGAVVVAGSIYLAGLVRSTLTNRPFRPF